MVLLKFAFASALALRRLSLRQPRAPADRAAFAAGKSTAGAVEVRNAGPDSMRSDLPQWDNVDQASDKSYPACDPLASHRFT